jgi:biotin carboxylase
MSKKKVLILGASKYYLKSIQSVMNAGYHVIVADKNPNADAFKVADEFEVCDTIDKEGILSVAQKHKINGIVSVNDFGIPTAAYVAAKMNLPGISEEVAFLATDKQAMRKKWLEVGVPCPQVEIGTSEMEIKAAVKKVGYPCVLKPAHGIGGGSRGVVVVRNESELDKGIEFSQSFYDDKETLIESFIESEYEHSAECLVYNGEVYILAVSDKVKAPMPYRVDTNVLYPSLVTGKRLEELKKVVTKSILSLGITTGAAHVELATTKNGFSLFELGARCGGGGTPEPICTHVSGVNQFLEQVKILVGDTNINLHAKSENPCNYNFVILKPGKIKKIEADLDSILKHPDVLDAGMIAQEGQVIERLATGSDRGGFIITKGRTREEAWDIGKQLEQLIHVEYYR